MIDKKDCACNAFENMLLPEPVKIIEYKRHSPDTFSMKLDWQAKHDPGDFAMVSLPGIGEAPISVSSFSKEHIELTIREVGNVTKAMGKLKKGDTVMARGPYGHGYPMHYFKGNSLVLIGGGCGVAPLKSVIEYMQQKRDDFKDIYLFFGFRTAQDVLYEKEIKQWEKDFKLMVSLDNKPSRGVSCVVDANIGFVTQYLQAANLSNDNKVVLLCGPPIMIQKCIEILKGQGFHDDQIFVSEERLMYCGVGKCGHCMIKEKYTCVDGPVFRYDQIKDDL